MDDIPTIMATYTSWTPLSDTPVDISAQIFSLCRSPTASEVAFTQSAHSHYALRDWVNALAKQGVDAQGVGGFAVGSAIVKEKFATDATTGMLVLAARGIMVKRPAGFDAAAGDWEFVYWNPTDGVSRGSTQLATCTACHAGTGATDFVFLDSSWRTATP